MKKGLCVILCMIISISVSGCWSRKEPKSLAIVNSVIYDIKDDGSYQVISEIMNPSAQGGVKEGGSGKSPNITAISEGKSVPEAIRNASVSLEKAIFGGHNKVRFFSERFARKDMVSIMDYLLRDHLTDENPLMVVIKNKDPKQVYSCMLGLSDTVGDYMDNLSKSQPKIICKSVFIKTLDFIKDYYDEGKQPVAGVAELVECEAKPSNGAGANAQGSQNSLDKQYRINYEGLAAFKDNKLVGYMDGVEARAYNLITNNVDTAIVSIPLDNDMAVVLVNQSKAGIKTAVEDDQISITVKIKINMSIVQESGDIDISKIEPLKTVEDSFNKQIEEEITESIKKAQTEFQSDIFGFGKAVHTQHPEIWKEIKESWDDYFNEAAINVTVESSAFRSGEIKQPFRLED